MNELKQKKTKVNKHTKQKISRRKNAKIYPIYKMFSWDLICFYSIEFLFYTITKGITPSEVLIISACYFLFRILMQLPAVTITDKLGRRKSMIIGNSLVFLYTISLMLSPNLFFMILSGLIRALGFDIKTIVETNLLYDSVATKGGEGLYSKLDSKGLSWYYWLDGIACLCAGYLFVINNYLPMIVCMIFSLISTIISFGFKDVYINEKEEKKKLSQEVKEYFHNMELSVKFCLRSSRMRAYTIFGALFYAIITAMDIYRSELIISKGVSEEQYSTIFAIYILLAGISVSLNRKLQKKFKNKTLTVLSLTYIVGALIAAIAANTFANNIALPIIILVFALLKMCSANWNMLEYKYLKNFTMESVRNKIMFIYEFIGGIVTSTLSLIGSILLNTFNINQAFLLFILGSCIAIVLSLDYMRGRVGLKPKEYKKQDIDFDLE